MGKGKLERFSHNLRKRICLNLTIKTKTGEETNAFSKDRLVEWIKNDNDLEAFVVGAVVEVSGTVQKRVKRDGQCKLVIEPGASVPGFVVFADCEADAEKVRARKIRKGSSVAVRGKFQTFGASAVCLSDCRLQEMLPTGDQVRRSSPQKRNKMQQMRHLKKK